MNQKKKMKNVRHPAKNNGCGTHVCRGGEPLRGCFNGGRRKMLAFPPTMPPPLPLPLPLPPPPLPPPAPPFLSISRSPPSISNGCPIPF
ncbi:hypothetical protein QJS10_CPA05g02237 [Acorus calamus]|uniref:Uncharacterized protein n=1 Tax=Acorus calamus TaxID=4465 RepID=A0AAV9ERR9_ACOCL|nr:hypothetical protein QJS10_CPA05g02237 [Acorus calamus]